MRELLLGLAGLWALGSPVPARGQDFEVELFAPRTVRRLALQAGRESTNLCGLAAPRACLHLNPGERADCVPTASSIRCSSANATREFHSLAAFSPAPFRAEMGFAVSPTSTRGFTLRTVKLAWAQGGLRVVAQTDLESYVAGVLAGEASILKTPAARAAMAIVARTWAERWRGRHHAEGFDFCSLTHCQVLRLLSGAGSDSPSVQDEAVRQTKGRVLEFRGQLIDPYFSACCGGRTEAAKNVWPDRAQPYLISLRDPYCAGSEHASWQRVLSLEVVGAILRRSLGLPLDGPLTTLAIAQTNSSGRAQALRVVAGSERRIDANEFRYAANRRLGWATLKSNLYTLDRLGSTLVFSGRGLGHGVGLCQAGAEQMGKMGFTPEQILAAYFPGTTLGALAAQDPDPLASSEHFELLFPSGQQAWVQQTLEALEGIRRELGKRAEVLPKHIRLQTWDTTEEFIRATGQWGWAAASNDGQSIALQPLSLLQRKGTLTQTLRHELMHLVVHQLRAPGGPHWFQEGLVLYLTRERIVATRPALGARRSLEEAVSKPRSEAEMKAAYALALARVEQLAQAQGESALWRTLQKPTPEDLRWLRETGRRRE